MLRHELRIRKKFLANTQFFFKQKLLYFVKVKPPNNLSRRREAKLKQNKQPLLLLIKKQI
jgi:hypothetical protein